MQPASLLVITCGAIAREVMAVAKSSGWQHLKVTQIPAELHNRPEKIPAAVEELVPGGKPQVAEEASKCGCCEGQRCKQSGQPQRVLARFESGESGGCG